MAEVVRYLIQYDSQNVEKIDEPILKRNANNNRIQIQTLPADDM